MHPVTATAFLAAAASLGIQQAGGAGPWGRRLARLLGCAVALMGVLRLALGLIGMDTGGDGPLFSAGLYDDPMSPCVAFCFALLGAALALLDGPQRRLAPALTLTSAGIALLAVVGYAYSVVPLHDLLGDVPMAFNTAAAFLVLCLGVLCALPDREPMATLMSVSEGGTTARRLLPSVFLIPLLLGWLRFEGQRRGLYGTSFGIVLLVVSCIGLLMLSLWWNARLQCRLDARRREAEGKLRAAHDALEGRIREATTELAAANRALRAEIAERQQAEAEIHALNAHLQCSNQELMLAYDATIEGWSLAMDLRDKETEGHTRRVTEMALRLARALGVGEADLVPIRRGALLHDIGKLAVPDRILLKPGPLTDEEWQVMRKHPEYALAMLYPVAFLRPALEIPYCHHEKWDGSGYPRGLRGEEIPLSARIFAVVDVWDALRSDRPYRGSWPEERVLAHIASLAGAHFDPRVVAAFLELVHAAPASPRDGTRSLRAA